MRELSLNILDICQNSVSAGATNIDIAITAEENLLTIEIRDNGKGMSEAFVKNVTDPFTTSRTTRKVGMGIPLFKQAAESAGGRFSIQSKEGDGTTVTATFEISHIDRMPLGSVAETLTSLILTAPRQDYTLSYTVNGKSYAFSTAEVKEILGGVPIESLEIIAYIKDLIQENMAEINGGTIL